MNHILSARQFTPEYQEQLYHEAEELGSRLNYYEDYRLLAQKHLGLVVATMFYEPSTRTKMSFDSAAQRLGASVIGTENASYFSSAIKGETLEDTTKTVARLADVMVLRHPETGSAEIAAAQNVIPIINGGDGKGEHPTQALLDLHTIRKEKGRLNDLTVVIGGDLKRGRTARSLALMLSQYDNNQMRFVSTPEYQIGSDIKDHILASGTKIEETDDMYSAFEGADAIYWTRLQRERSGEQTKEDDIPIFPALPATTEEAVEILRSQMDYVMAKLIPKPAEMQASHFIIGQAELQTMDEQTILMHPLPRVDEIHQTVDSDPRAKYFEQVENGLHVRMAILDQFLKQAAEERKAKALLRQGEL
jgi:aspartate carbamoyltransferase catalytic subunit